jgi:hypothetical protein
MSAFAAEFLDVCTQTICWEPMISRDQYGKPAWGAAQTFPGRRTYTIARVPAQARVRGEGAELVSSSNIIILGTPLIKYEDAVYVLGDPTPYPPILNIERHVDETGFEVYVKVSFGSANG